MKRIQSPLFALRLNPNAELTVAAATSIRIISLRSVAIAVWILGALSSFAGAEIPIQYTLPKEGRVSLAVYDSDGRMIRTLLNAAPQKAGAQSVTWDGLDSKGQPAITGDYSWKLLLSQGMKAEYLLSLGTSVGVDHWTAQHGGPTAVEAVPGGDVLAGAATEGSPMIVRLNPQTSRTPWVNDVWAGGGVTDIAILEGVVYTMHEGGRVRKFDLATGKPVAGEFRPDLPGEELGPIEPSQETKRLPFAGRRGAFRIRGEIVFPDGGGEVKILAGGQSSATKSPSGAEKKFAAPGEDGPQSQMGEYDASTVKEIVFEPGPMVGNWSAPSVRIEGVASHLSGGDGVLAASYPAVNQVAWMDPTGKILAKVEVEAPKSLAVVDAQTLLVISENEVLELKRDGTRKTVIAGLVAPEHVAVDSKSGQIFVGEAGKLQQIKRFSRAGKSEGIFGREGGRKPGKYVPEDFLMVSDISADGAGGFWITEALSAPRRTAHFDGEGKLIGEWFGGQQFYTWAAPDPEDSNILWMDSQWGWIMKVQVDWDKRTWKVLATYAWGDDYSPELVNRSKMASQHHVRKLDLDKDGKKETYLVSDVGMQKVDEESGRLRMVSALGMIAVNRGWGWDDVPLEKQPKPWLDAIALRGEDPAKAFKNYQGFSWADANGDFEFQPEEFRLLKSDSVMGKNGFLLTDDLSIIKTSGWGENSGEGKPNWLRFPLQGYTATGSPIWDWTKSEPLPMQVPGSPRELFIAPSGDMYQIVHGAGGDGYTGLTTFGMGHGFAWPANQSSEVSVWKWNAKGDLRWRVGTLATAQNNAPGQLHHPVHFAGLVNGTIGVCDKVVLPVAFWTEDGLYAGSLFDRRAEDGLPKRIYSWWNAGTDDFNPETGRSLFQYDMILGGSLIKRPNGDVIFIGSGWNNCPAYRVTGWDEFERLEGKVKVGTPTTVAARTGTGLSAEFFADNKSEGNPVLSLVSPRIWFEPARSAPDNAPGFKWPEPKLEKPQPGMGAGSPEDDLELEEKPKPFPGANEVAAVRWTGAVEPAFSEDYTFNLYRKDGNAKLWIDGRLVAETQPGADRANSAPLSLKSGQKYNLKLEWSGKRAGELHLSWQSVSQPIEHIPMRSLYPVAAAPSKK